MTARPADHLLPLSPVIGHWRTAGSVVDEAGRVTEEIAGTDIYSWLPGGHWIAHEVDVTMGAQRTLAHELIGGRADGDRWHMYAFDETGEPGHMLLSHHEPGLLLLDGAEIRSWFSIRAGDHHMTTRWERRVDDAWLLWMDLRFDRAA